ncbi:MAG: Crp/Fnr family transcriptional regulator [Pseudomonadota bacterium]
MLRECAPVQTDQIEAFSDSTWSYIQEHGEFFTANEGDTLLEIGQTDDHLLIILSGLATLIYLEDGRPQPTAIFRVSGEVLHHSGMHLQIANPFRIDAAEDDTRVVLLRRKVIYDVISRDLEFAEFLFKDLSERFMVAMAFLREQRQEPLIIRLAKRFLLITKHRDIVEYTQAELASILAVTRISISKALKTLEDEGLVRRVERAFIEVDREKLKVWLEEHQ